MKIYKVFRELVRGSVTRLFSFSHQLAHRPDRQELEEDTTKKVTKVFQDIPDLDEQPSEPPTVEGDIPYIKITVGAVMFTNGSLDWRYGTVYVRSTDDLEQYVQDVLENLEDLSTSSEIREHGVMYDAVDQLPEGRELYEFDDHEIEAQEPIPGLQGDFDIWFRCRRKMRV